jgi:DNA-binding NarL/FixJ family response regulator
VRLLIVDDHHVVRLGLTDVFQGFPQFQIVGEAGTMAEAIDAAAELKPDVVLMDIRLPDGSGVEACREIRSHDHDINVVMLTSYSDEEALVNSIMAGASGYLLKRSEPERLVEAVEKVAAGQALLDPEITSTLLRLFREGGYKPDPFEELTDQEKRLLPLIVEGKTNRQIGEELSLSPHTIKAYVSSILQKLNLTRRVELASLAAGHLHPPQSPPPE